MKTIFKKWTLMLSVCIPVLAFTQATSFDSDGDGIPDSTDACAFVKGTKNFNGCPYAKNVTADDRDGDGVKNANDACADIFGEKSRKGCPLESAKQAATPEGGASAYTTTSSSAEWNMNEFKDALFTVISDTAGLAVEPYPNQAHKYTSKVCLTGANECYISTEEGKYFCATYGTYAKKADADEQFASIKKKLVATLGETEWDYTTTRNGPAEQYQIKRKRTGNATDIVTLYMSKTGEKHNIYLVAEKK